MVGYEFVGTALDKEEDELPASMSLSQRMAPSLTEFERGRDAITGKRQFQGAFHGGWDRGKVVSREEEEEWKPTAFVSSRERRARPVNTQLEDLMDEEDLADVGGPATRGTNGGNFEIIAKRLDGGVDKGYELLRRMGWKVGGSIGSNKGEHPTIKTIGPQPRESTELREILSVNFGRFLEDVAAEKADRAGLGYSTGSLGDSGLQEDEHGPVRRKIYAEEGEFDVYGDAVEPEALVTEIGPQVVSVTESQQPHDQSLSRAMSGSSRQHPKVRDFLVVETLEDTKEGSVRSEDDHLPIKPHDFENDKFTHNLQLPSVLITEAVKIKNAEQRRLLLGEKSLTRRSETAPQPDAHASATPGGPRDADAKQNFGSFGDSVSSRFVAEGTYDVSAQTGSLQSEVDPITLDYSSRAEVYFQPNNLLCKRFNVPQPEVGLAKIVSTQGIKTSRFTAAANEIDHRQRDTQQDDQDQDVAPTEVDDVQLDVVLEAPIAKEDKPSDAMFKAIFGDESDDEQ